MEMVTCVIAKFKCPTRGRQSPGEKFGGATQSPWCIKVEAINVRGTQGMAQAWMMGWGLSLLPRAGDSCLWQKSLTASQNPGWKKNQPGQDRK